MSSVEVIINALAELEKDIDNLNLRVAEMKKRIIIYSNEQIENLKQQITSIANEEAKRIVDIAKKEAEEESSLIAKEADNRLSDIKKNIDSSLDRAVDSIINIVIGGEAGPSLREQVNVSKDDETVSQKTRNSLRKESQKKDSLK